MPQVDRPTTEEEELELPPLDGESEDAPETAEDADDVAIRDEDDPYDDAAGDDEDFAEEVDPQNEASALGDDDVGFSTQEDEPVTVDAAGESMLGDEDAPGVAGEDFGLVEDGDSIRDGGEEGFDAPEPELRVEDLPRLDQGDDDDLSVEETVGEPVAASELRWDDRGFDRVLARAVGHVVRIRVRAGVEITLEDGKSLRSLDGGETFSDADAEVEDDEALVVRGRVRALLRDGAGILRALDDGPLVLVESTAEATAFTVLDDGSIVAAIDTPEGARLLRIPLEGGATVIAEEDGTIEAVAVDPRTGVIYCGGAFGLSAYRPS